MEASALRAAVNEILESPGLVDQAARLAYVRDGGDPQGWRDADDRFRAVFRSSVRQSLECVVEVLPEGRRHLRAA